MAEPTGLAAVVGGAIGDRPIVPEPAEQLDLLAMVGLHRAPEQRRTRGRPPGATNRRTQQVADYLLSRYPDPLEGLFQMSSLGVDEMAEALGCTKMEAFQELRLCRIATLAYVHRRQPQEVDLTNRSVVHLSIHTGDAASSPSGEGGVTLLGTLVTIEENQEVSDGTDAQV